MEQQAEFNEQQLKTKATIKHWLKRIEEISNDQAKEIEAIIEQYSEPLALCKKMIEKQQEECNHVYQKTGVTHSSTSQSSRKVLIRAEYQCKICGKKKFKIEKQ